MFDSPDNVWLWFSATHQNISKNKNNSKTIEVYQMQIRYNLTDEKLHETRNNRAIGETERNERKETQQNKSYASLYRF